MDATNAHDGIVDRQTPPDRMRAADADREQVAEKLRSAHADGRLDLTEYDERVQQAWAARAYGELEALTSDLPQAQPSKPDARLEARQAHRRCRNGSAGRAAVSAWAGASLINLVIWAIVCLSTMSWIYPWWIWVAGPFAAVLLSRRLGGRAAAPRGLR